MTSFADPAIPASPRRFRLLRHNVTLWTGVVLVGLVAFMALAAPLLAPHDPYAQSLANRLLPPFWVEGGRPEHLLGTDQLGRDYLSRLIYGARVSMGIGLVTVLISGTIGITLGILGGYFGGWVDGVVSWLISVRLAMPAVIVGLTVVALFGNSLQTIVLVLGLMLWDQFAIVSRSVTRQIMSLDYIMAARSMGTPTWRILISDVFVNILPMVIVVATVEMASAIMVETSLSFLGLGVQPPTPSWGLMMADGKENIFFTPWLILFPGIALFCMILGVNMLGDGLRDKVAPPQS